MELKEAFDAAIDARLIELGLLEDPNAGKGKAKGKAAAKGGKDAEEEITEETLKDKLTELVNKADKDTAKALLKRAKVAKLGDLAEKHYGAFNKLLDEALEAAGGEAAGGDDDIFGG